MIMAMIKRADTEAKQRLYRSRARRGIRTSTIKRADVAPIQIKGRRRMRTATMNRADVEAILIKGPHRTIKRVDAEAILIKGPSGMRRATGYTDQGPAAIQIKCPQRDEKDDGKERGC